MKLKAYAKVNLILNVLGTRPDGFHEVETLMQAISLCDYVSVACYGPALSLANAGSAADEPSSPCKDEITASCADEPAMPCSTVLTPDDFEYGERDLAWRAALLMAQTFRPDLLAARPTENHGSSCADDPTGRPGLGIRGVRIRIEKRIPAAAGLAGGSADAAAVMIGLGKFWVTTDNHQAIGTENAASPEGAGNSLLRALLPLGARLGSDVPFCIASQLGHPAAIARGTGTKLEFVEPTDCAVTLYFSGASIPDKTRSVYAELKDEDCRPRYDIQDFLAAECLAEKRALMGNHLQAPAERLLGQCGPQNAILCGAGPTYFTIGEDGPFSTVC